MKFYRKSVYKKHRNFLQGEVQVFSLFEELENKSNLSNLEIYSYSYKLITLSLEMGDYDIYCSILEFCLKLYKREFDKRLFGRIRNYYIEKGLGNYIHTFNVDDFTFFASDQQFALQSIYNFYEYIKNNSQINRKYYFILIGRGSINAGLDLYLSLREKYLKQFEWDIDILNFSYYKKGERVVTGNEDVAQKIRIKRSQGYDIILFQEDIHEGRSLFLVLDWINAILGNEYKPIVMSNLVSSLFNQNAYDNKIRWVGLKRK